MMVRIQMPVKARLYVQLHAGSTDRSFSGEREVGAYMELDQVERLIEELQSKLAEARQL